MLAAARHGEASSFMRAIIRMMHAAPCTQACPEATYPQPHCPRTHLNRSCCWSCCRVCCAWTPSASCACRFCRDFPSCSKHELRKSATPTANLQQVCVGKYLYAFCKLRAIGCSGHERGHNSVQCTLNRFSFLRHGLQLFHRILLLLLAAPVSAAGGRPCLLTCWHQVSCTCRT